MRQQISEQEHHALVEAGVYLCKCETTGIQRIPQNIGELIEWVDKTEEKAEIVIGSSYYTSSTDYILWDVEYFLDSSYALHKTEAPELIDALVPLCLKIQGSK